MASARHAYGSMRMQARTNHGCPSEIVAIACLAIAAGRAHAAPTDYTVDPTHTRIAFRVEHAGFSRALGTFAGATGTLRFDPDDWSTAKLTLAVPVASLDLGDAEWNRKVLDGTFFDAARLPQATFASTAVEKIDDQRMQVRGELTIHGVTRPVAFEAMFNALKRHPLNFKRTAGFSAVLTVSRKDFGMGAWASVIGDEVEILVELEATKARGPDEKLPLPATDPPGREHELVDPPRDDAVDDPPDDDAAAA
jgi:polyisoprenoid-binding protein YceI